MRPRRQLDLTGLHVMDGALATALEAAGCDISGPLWSGRLIHEAPEKIEALHLAYLEAGADLLSTASYQVSREGYLHQRLPDVEAMLALRKSVEIAERACTRYHQKHRRPIWLAASLGPYGAAMHNGAEYTGVYPIDHQALIAFHLRRIKAIATTGADFMLFETIPSLDEAEAIVSALAGAPDLAAAVSFTCRDERCTAHGEDILACVEKMDAAEQVIAIGVNCLAPALVAPVLRRIRHATSKKIAVYPNLGEVWNAPQQQWQNSASAQTSPEEWHTLALQWRAAGADWIGGCCRTTPSHIRAIRRAFAQY